MALRIRSLKPEFYNDDEFATLSIWARHIYPGLWLAADREGRLEDKPKRLKTQIMPYDDVDMDALINELADFGALTRYEVEGVRIIQIEKFLRHQKPGKDEPPSELPERTGAMTAYIRPPNETVRQRLYERDRYTCCYCGDDMGGNTRKRCLDHVVPVARGGSHHERNLVTSCKRCSERKRERTPTEAGMTWPEGFGLTIDDHAPEVLHDTRGTLQPQLIVVENPHPLTDGQRGVNGGVNGGLTTPLSMVNGVRTLKEWEGEGEKEWEGEGNKVVTTPPPAVAIDGLPPVLPNGFHSEPEPIDPESPEAIEAKRQRFRRQLKGATD